MLFRNYISDLKKILKSLNPLESDAPVIVYLDFKSPYAFLAIDATRRLENDLKLRFDWRPFVLDIPSYLGSASLDESGAVADQDRTLNQWAAVKYAYYDCRRYASASKLTIRGTTKIWDTNLAATAMLWVRKQAPDQLAQYIDLVYTPFWKRELDIEDMTSITAILEACDLSGRHFEEWAHVEGDLLNAQLQKSAFDSGIYGVPTYIVGNENYFGREHLPRIAWHLSGEVGPAPDIENLLPTYLSIEKIDRPDVLVGLDESLDSLLAIPKLKTIFQENSIQAEWSQIESKTLGELMPPADKDTRSDLHRRYREENQLRNQQRYARNIKASSNIARLIQSELNAQHITLARSTPINVPDSPFPGVRVTINDQVFIGRQHLPMIHTLIT